MLTKAQKQAYLKASHKCPYCGSRMIEGTGERTFDGDDISQKVECQDCRKTWWDIYRLHDIEEEGEH